MESNAANTPDTPLETVAQPSALERRVELSLSIADLEKEVDQQLRKIGKTVKMPGFRPGKVPANIVRQQYGDEARNEALGEALSKAFSEAVNAQQLRVAGRPSIEPKQSEDATQMIFTAVFEVYPEITLNDLGGAEIERPTLEVGAAEIQDTIDVLRKQRVKYEPRDRAAAKGDRVVIDFLGKKDDTPFDGGEAKDYPFVLGEGAMLPDFEAAVDGLKAGDAKTFELTFPADYFSKDLAGQTVSFDIAVKEVGEAVLPEVDADFAKALGMADGDVDKMRTEIENNLKREVKKRLQARIKDQVMEALLKTQQVDLPKALVEDEIERQMEAARQNMEQRLGRAVKDFPMQPEWFSKQAQRRVSLGLIISEIIKEKQIQAKPEQIRAIVEEAAQSYEHPEEVVRWYYAQPKRLAEIEGLALEDNVVEWVLSCAKVVDKPISLDELMGRKAQ